MSKRAFVTLLVLGVACSPPPPPPPQDVLPFEEASATATPDPAKFGPYPVGVRDFVIDAPERQIPVTVWYPALNPEGAEEFVAYSMDFLADPAAGFPTGGRALQSPAGSR